MGQKIGFPGTPNSAIFGIFGPPGPRDPENRIRHVLLYNPVDFEHVWTDMKPFPDHFWIFTPAIIRPEPVQTRPTKPPWEPPRDAHGTPGPLGTPPGTSWKVRSQFGSSHFDSSHFSSSSHFCSSHVGPGIWAHLVLVGNSTKYSRAWQNQGHGLDRRICTTKGS